MDTQQYTHFNSGEHLDPILGYPERDIKWFDKNIYPDLVSLLLHFEGPISPAGRLADIGCAKGYFTRYYADLFDSVTGFDFAKTRIAQAIALHAGGNLNFDVLDISAESISDEYVQKFDTAITSAVIQHINPKDRYQVFKNICLMLKPGGKLIMYESFLEKQKDRQLHATAQPWNGNIELLSTEFIHRKIPFFTMSEEKYICNSGGDFHIYRIILTSRK